MVLVCRFKVDSIVHKKHNTSLMQKTLVLFSFLLMSILPSHAQKVNVEAVIDSIAIMVGEQTGYHVGVTVKEGQRVQFPLIQPSQMLTSGVEVVETLPSDTQHLDDGYMKVAAHYTLTSFDDTLYYIPPMKVKVDGKEYESKSLALKVLTVEVDTLHPNQFFPQKDIQALPFLWSEWSSLIWLCLAVLLLYVLCGLMFVRLKSKKPIVFSVKIIKLIPPHQKALTVIEEIKSQSVSTTPEDNKKYYTQLTDALRQYMNERFGFNAMEMTSSEIIERLKKERDQEKIQELTMLFETADLVKFAKYSVGVSENDQNLISAINFINETKQENLPTEQRIQPTVTEQERQTIRTRISLKWGIAIVGTVATVLLGYISWQFWSLI